MTLYVVLTAILCIGFYLLGRTTRLSKLIRPEDLEVIILECSDDDDTVLVPIGIDKRNVSDTDSVIKLTKLNLMDKGMDVEIVLISPLYEIFD